MSTLDRPRRQPGRSRRGARSLASRTDGPGVHGRQNGRRVAGPTRREIGIPTAFNLLGPLTNPAQPSAALVGCAHVRLAPILAEVLAGRGFSVLVVHGDDGLDEITTTAATDVAELRAGEVRRFRVEPEALGLSRCSLAELQVTSAEESAEVIRTVLSGRPGPARDIVILNAGAAIYAADRAPSLGDGIAAARSAIDSGRAREILERVACESRAGVSA